MSRRIEEMRNLGPVTARGLREAGIENEDDLRRLGAVEAFIRLRFFSQRGISLNALYAMHAALNDSDWRMVSAAEKVALRAAVTPDESGPAGAGSLTPVRLRSLPD